MLGLPGDAESNEQRIVNVFGGQGIKFSGRKDPKAIQMFLVPVPGWSDFYVDTDATSLVQKGKK